MTGGYLPQAKMKNTLSKPGMASKTSSNTKSKLSANATETAPSVNSSSVASSRISNKSAPSVRKTASTIKLTKSLSRSQDSISYPSTTAKSKLNTSVVKTRPQSALGLQNSKFEKKVNSKHGMNNNSGSICKSTSKDSIDSINNKNREKENVMKAVNNKKSTSSTIALLEKEKKVLEQRVSELIKNSESRKAEIATLKMEINKNDSKTEDSNELHILIDENKLLRERLTQVGFNADHIALSDTEKELLLKRSKMPRSVQSLPDVIDSSPDFQATSPLSLGSLPETKGVISTEFSGIEDLAEGAGCSYNPIDRTDWDKQSNSSVSEVSVACLQDRINQMEENHYSTNEELQATLQELSDLQDQLTDLQIDNEQMRDEKSVMLESLCSQTEKLEECRSQICSLKQLLFHQGSDGSVSTPLNQSEREQKFLELLKSAEVERESYVTKCEDLVNKVHIFQEKSVESEREIAALQDRNKLLNSTIGSANADKKVLDKQLADLKEQVDSGHIEIARVNSLLDNERQKVNEVQRAREAEGKSELDRLVDAARKEKDEVEMRATALQEQLALCQCEVTRLKENISVLQDEAMVAKNNAKKNLSDMQYQLEQVRAEKEQAVHSTQVLEEAIHELEMKCQRHLEDKRELKASISDLQKNCLEAVEKMNEAQQQYGAVKVKLQADTEEWKQFQNDLLITVRVANDFKMEAQLELDRLTEQNESLRKKNNSLKNEFEKLKTTTTAAATTTSHSSEVFSNVEQDLANRRQTLGGKRGAASQLSVRGLIESIESATKQAKAQGPYSRSSSSSSLSSCTSETKISPPQPVLRRSENDVYIKPPFRQSTSEIFAKDKKISPSTPLPSKSQRSSYTEGYSSRANIVAMGKENTLAGQVNKSAEGHPPIDGNAKPVVSILASKLDPMRRNSYSDICDKKDPLATLAKNGGSKRNALLKWCQNKVIEYKSVDVTNFSSSWNDGLAFCALLHSYLPDKIPYDELDSRNKKKNFTLAFQAAESVGIQSTLNISDMISMERPDWQSIMGYVTLIYKHFET